VLGKWERRMNKKEKSKPLMGNWAGLKRQIGEM
jgi:hypothetical protein